MEDDTLELKHNNDFLFEKLAPLIKPNVKTKVKPIPSLPWKVDHGNSEVRRTLNFIPTERLTGDCHEEAAFVEESLFPGEATDKLKQLVTAPTPRQIALKQNKSPTDYFSKTGNHPYSDNFSGRGNRRGNLRGVGRGRPNDYVPLAQRQDNPTTLGRG